MNLKSVYDICIEMYKKHDFWHDGEYNYFGLRFENLERNVGDVITQNSKDNPDREDERNFPEYGTEEYASLPDLDGVSCWFFDEYSFGAFDEKGWGEETTIMNSIYAYVIAGNEMGNHPCPDEGEILIKSPVVLAKIKLR